MIKRRSILKRIGTAGIAASFIGSVPQVVSAERDGVWLDADSELNTSDSDNDGGATIDTTGDDLYHDYYIEARADEEQEHDSGCKGEDCTTIIYQERYDCVNDYSFFKAIDSVSVSVEEGYAEAWDDGTVSTNGDDWKATGKYKVTVEACQLDTNSCYDNWDSVCNKETGYMNVSHDLGVCGVGTCSDAEC